jgi:hypothetical protein
MGLKDDAICYIIDVTSAVQTQTIKNHIQAREMVAFAGNEEYQQVVWRGTRAE